MRVLLLQTRETRTFNDSYSARLIEQGRAIPAPPEKKTAAKSGKEKTAGKE